MEIKILGTISWFIPFHETSEGFSAAYFLKFLRHKISPNYCCLQGNKPSSLPITDDLWREGIKMLSCSLAFYLLAFFIYFLCLQYCFFPDGVEKRKDQGAESRFCAVILWVHIHLHLLLEYLVVTTKVGHRDFIFSLVSGYAWYTNEYIQG